METTNQPPTVIETLTRAQTRINHLLLIALKAASPVDHRIEAQTDTDEPGLILDDEILIYPSTVMVQTLAGKREVPAFAADQIVQISGDYYTPPDVDYVEIALSQNLSDVVAAVALFQIKENISCAMEHYAIREMERVEEQADADYQKMRADLDEIAESEYRQAFEEDEDFAFDAAREDRMFGRGRY